MRTVIAAAFGATLAIALAAVPASSHDFNRGELTIEHPWARASAGPVGNGAAFFVIRNAGASDRLVAVASELAERAELHQNSMAGDIMRMRPVEAVEVPAGGTASLQPGGHHIMLIGLHKALKEGDRFALTLTFEKAGEVTVQIAVEAVGSMGPQGDASPKGMDHGTMDHGSMPTSN
ncbi:MAG: copper chaperone PCu(A)C [Kiloniellaceae bacterium]